MREGKNLQEKKNRRKKLYELVSDAVELPPDAIAPIPVFVIRGEHEVEIEGCDGILEYDENRVALSVKGRRSVINGSKLVLSDFRGSILTVRGNIYAVDLTGDTSCSNNSENS